MSKFKIHTKETATPESAKLLADAEKAYGFIPNLLGVMAESPAMLQGYLTLGTIFDKSSFSPVESQVILLAASRSNECQYCMAAHSTIADMHDVPAEVVEAIREDRQIPDNKLETLRNFTMLVIEKRGWVSNDDVTTFLAAGYAKAHVFEVLLAVSYKTLSNYVNHITDTPVDDAFAAHDWQPVPRQAVG
jgi:uncharacterized peroxidase-related enzyme